MHGLFAWFFSLTKEMNWFFLGASAAAKCPNPRYFDEALWRGLGSPWLMWRAWTAASWQENVMIFKLKSLFSQLGLESPHGKQVAHSVALRGIKGWSSWLFFSYLPKLLFDVRARELWAKLKPIALLSFHLGLGASGRLLWVESVWKTHVWLKLGDLTGRGLLHRQLAEISSRCGISFASRFAEVTFLATRFTRSWFICC